jgi:2-polyprenyl-3-methyl-5-hydroxy-6-metoxy-1,4-benzoquinol methylase
MIKKKWDEKYKKLQKKPKVNLLLQEFYTLATKNRALDIACGIGQNATFLANRGFIVDVVDISEVGLSKFNHKNINKYSIDIRDFQFKKSYYDLIICTNFLDRTIFKKISTSLKKGGVLIFETYTYKKKGFNTNFVLEKNELLKVFANLEIIYYKSDTKASLVAIK